MRLLARLYRIIATTLGLVIGVPWLIGTFLFFVACSLAGGFLLFSMLRGLFAGTEILSDLPSTALGVLGFALCLIPALGLGLLHWSDYTGLSLGFLQRGDSHGSARLSTRKERAALQRGDGLLIGRDAESNRLLRYDGPAHLLTLAPTPATTMPISSPPPSTRVGQPSRPRPCPLARRCRSRDLCARSSASPSRVAPRLHHRECRRDRRQPHRPVGAEPNPHRP